MEREWDIRTPHLIMRLGQAQAQAGRHRDRPGDRDWEGIWKGYSYRQRDRPAASAACVLRLGLRFGPEFASKAREVPTRSHLTGFSFHIWTYRGRSALKTHSDHEGSSRD